MATVAYHNQWYDNSITYMRLAIEMVKDQMGSDSSPHNNTILGQQLEEMKRLGKRYVEHHNALVTKRQRFIDGDMKCFRYLVDPETLKKKKTQPKGSKQKESEFVCFAC